MAALAEWSAVNDGVSGFAGGEAVAADFIFSADVDVVVPAALQNQLTVERAQTMTCDLVIEAANGPTTPEAEVLLAEKGIPVVPDILANAGGVIVSYFEWLQNKSFQYWTEEEVDNRLRSTVWDAHDAVLVMKRKLACTRREAAYAVALERLADVYDRRGIFP